MTNGFCLLKNICNGVSSDAQPYGRERAQGQVLQARIQPNPYIRAGQASSSLPLNLNVRHCSKVFSICQNDIDYL